MKIQKHIKIDLNKSAFAYPVRVVQYDTGVQLVLTLTDFEIPDGTTAIVYFMKPSGKFVYQEDNISISDNIITVDVHNQAFTEHGKVKYQVELTNGSDIITTFSRMVEVEKSLSNSGGDKSTTVIRAFEELTSEKIAEIEASTLEFIESVKQDIEAKGEEVLATIPDDYTEMSNKVDYLYDNVANALKGNVSGSVVAVDDVSPIEHKPTINVHSKNLIDVSKIEVQTSDNIYISAVGEGYIEITTTSGYVSNGHRQTYTKLKNLCPQMKPNRYYVLSADTESTLEMAHLRDVDYFIYFGTPVFITEEMLESYLAFYGLDTRTDTTGGTCRISNIQFEEGEIATEYTPYIDPTTVTVKKCGKNLFNVNAITTYGSVTNNGDGSITVKNLVSQPIQTFKEICPFLKPGDVATFSFNSPATDATKTSNNKFDFIYLVGSHESWKAGDFKTITQEMLDGAIYFYASKDSDGNAVTTTISKIQIEIGNVATEYETYKEPTEHTPETDGSIEDITSLFPNMVITTDTPNTVVDCEYIKDSNVVINKLINAIVALGGSV